jgi:ABC-2 type transport system permease protein
MIEDLGIVFVAELNRRIRSRPFLIGLLIGVIGIVGITRLPALIVNAMSGSNSIVLMGDASLTSAARPLLTRAYEIKTVAATQPVDAAFLKRENATAAVVVSKRIDGLAVTVYAHDAGNFDKAELTRELMPLQLQLATHRSAASVKSLSSIPVVVNTINSKFATSDEAGRARGLAYTLMMFLYILIIINSQLVTTSVAEEKTSRIAELLVASVNPSALLAGKVLSGAVLSLLQLVIWIATTMFLGGGGGPSNHGDSSEVFALNNLFTVLTPGVLVGFVVYFVIGFLQLSTLLAGCASLINRTEDLGSITGPLMIPIVAALIIALAALGAPDTSFAVVTSMVPLLSPFVMFARIAVSNVPLWQIGLSLSINVIALYFIAIFAGKIYRVGMLLYGRAPRLSQIWNVLRT